MATPKLTWLDEFFGPPTFKRGDDDVELPKRTAIRVDGVDDTVLYDDTGTGETVLDLSAISGGGSSGVASKVNYEGILTTGDVVVSALNNSDPTRVKIASTANLTPNGPTIRGVVVEPPSGGKVTIALPGSALATTITGLSAPDKPSRVVADATGQCVIKEPTSFGDAIVGWVDTTGILHVLPNQSRAGELVVNTAEYGVTGVTGQDPHDLIVQAITDAIEDNSTYPVIKTVRLPAGTLEITKPIRITPDPSTFPTIQAKRIRLIGEGDRTILRPTFMGPTIGVYFDYSQLYPAVVAAGPFSGGTSPAFQVYRLGAGIFEYPDHPFPIAYSAQIRYHGAGELNGLTAFTFEMWVYIEESTATVGNIHLWLCGGGFEGENPGIADTACIFGVNNAFGTEDELYCQLTFQNAGIKVLRSNESVSLNTWHHVAVSYDGTTARLLIDGAVPVDSHATASVSSDKLSQKPWEALVYGSGRMGHLEESFVDYFRGKLGPIRLSSTALYTGSYTVPTGAFPDGNFTDLFVLNWDENYLDTWKFHVGGLGTPGTSRPGYMMLRQPSDFANPAVFATEIEGFQIYSNNGVTCGGIFMQNATASKVKNISTTLTHFGLWGCSQTYDCLFEGLAHAGTGVFPGFIDNNTGGNVWSKCSADLNSYHWIIGSGLNTMSNCRMGKWGPEAAGILVKAGLVDIVSLFTDNEEPSANTRGAIYAVDSWVHLRASETSTFPITTEPMISNAGSTIEIETQAQTGNLYTAWVDIVRTPPGHTRVNVIDIVDPESVFRLTPPVTSSTGADLGKVYVESFVKSAGQPVAATYHNANKIENYQGHAATTNATPKNMSGTEVPLDLHSVYVLDLEVTARKDDGSDWAVWKLSNSFYRLTSVPQDGGAMGTTASVGSNSGAPPTGWDVQWSIDDYQTVNVEVTGAAATNIVWGANLVATRISGATSSVSSTDPGTMTGVVGWYQGDAGFVAATSWADQSSSSNDLTVTGAVVGPQLNSIDTVSFDGINDTAKIASFTKGSAGEISIFAVCKMTGNGNASKISAYEDELFDGQFLAGDGTAGTTATNHTGGVGNDIQGATSGATDLKAAWQIVGITGVTSGKQYFYHKTEREAGQDATASIADNLTFTIGSGKSTSFAPVDVAEVVVFDHALDADEIAGLVAYFEGRFAL